MIPKWLRRTLLPIRPDNLKYLVNLRQSTMIPWPTNVLKDPPYKTFKCKGSEVFITVPDGAIDKDLLQAIYQTVLTHNES